MGSFYFEDDHDEIKRKKDAAQNDFFARQSLFPQMEENSFADPFNTLGRIGGNIYAKYEISQPNDPAEQQADALASSVMQGDPQQSQDIISQPTTEISRQAEGDAKETNPKVTGSEFDNTLQSTKGQGETLDEDTQAELEAHTGADLSQVKIHTDSAADALSRSIGAKAFAQGDDIYFKEGEYAPETAGGKELLAHEVAHVVQGVGDNVDLKIQRETGDPELNQLISERLKFSTGYEAQIKAFHEGAPIVQVAEGDMDEAQVYVNVLLTQQVQKGDPDHIAYKAYLNQIFSFDNDKADAIIIARGGSTWTNNVFDEQLTVPANRTVHVGTKLFISRSINEVKDESKVKILEQYLISRETNLTPLDAASVKVVHEDLKLLNTLPTIETLVAEYNAVYSKNKTLVDLQQPKENTDNNTIDLGYNTSQIDNTAVVINKIALTMPSMKQMVVSTVFDNATIETTLAAKPVLKAIVCYALLKELEGKAIKENSQNLEPELYKNYLDFQETEILKSELYGELTFARSVYQQYWDHCWEIFRTSSEFANIKRNSQQAETNLGAYDDSKRKESIDYDAPLLWRIVEAKLYDSVFLALRNEYEDIPFQFMQFQRMWWKSGGDFDYVQLKIPANFLQPEKTEDDQSTTGGVVFLSDRDVVDMLASGFSINLSNIGDKKSTEGEISLVDQLGAMVTQLDTIRQTKTAIEDKLIGANVDKSNALPLPTVLLPKGVEADPVNLTLYLIKTADHAWKIMDFSVPTQGTPTYAGTGTYTSDKEAIAAALANFGQEATYPAGELIANGPKQFMGNEVRIKAYSTGENWEQASADKLSIISTIAGVLGLILVFTPLSPLGAGLLFVSGITGAGAAGLRMHDRMEHETFELDAQTMLDVIDIVSGVIVTGKIATTAFKTVNTAAKGSRVAVLVKGIEMGADVASVVIIGNQYLQRLQEVEQEFIDKKITEAERDAKRQAILLEAAAVGLLLLVGYAAPKLKKKFGKTRNKKLKESIDTRIKEEIDTHIGSPEYIKNRDAAWTRYSGTASRADWDIRYETLTRNRMKGKIAEEQFQLFLGGKKLSKKTSITMRHIDNFEDGVAREIKSGYLKDTPDVRKQVKKDILLLSDSKSGINKIEWHLFGGIDPDLQKIFEKAVQQFGKDKFNYIIY